MPLDLLKRAEAGAPLTSAQHDTNFTAIEAAIAALETATNLWPIAFQFTDGQADSLVVGDGRGWLVVPPAMNGMNIVSALAVVRTAGTTGTTDFQLRRRRAGADVDVLSTKLTIDSTEATSATAATAYVINTSNDDLVTGDILYLDIDAVSTTPPQGGGAVFQAQKP